MARFVARSVPLASRPALPITRPRISAALRWRSRRSTVIAFSLSHSSLFPPLLGVSQWRDIHSRTRYSPSRIPFPGSVVSARAFRKQGQQRATKKQKSKKKLLELDVKICIEEELPDDPEILSIAEMLRTDAPMAMKVAFDGLKHSKYKSRDSSITDVDKFDNIELSVLLCNDDFIRKLNKEWRDEDHATDVLSMSQHIPGLDIPILMLGDIVISIETAARQAEERDHTIVDEIRILLVHGLLHLLGFDHEISIEAETEMEKEEGLVLKSLGWKGKGLIKSAHDALNDGSLQAESSDGYVSDDMKKASNRRLDKPKFSYIFCDMDGTLLNSKSQISINNAEALREAVSRGVNIVIATGKGEMGYLSLLTRPAVISALEVVGLAGKGGVVSEISPGIFLQGLLVYGRQGREIYRRNLEKNVCREAFLYSLEHGVPLVAFCQDRCLTLFEHPLVDSLHMVYHEPKAEVMPSVEHLLAAADIQKLLFIDTAEGISSNLRPYWEEAARGRAGVVQAQADMLEIVPAGTNKGCGVKLLLDHLDVTAKEIMAIGDGENDFEMLQLASLGIALANGSEKTKAVADAIGATNDEDGVAKAIYQYAL
ncbi:putative sugar-phosphatase [Dioscorea sansibarensis]